MLEFVRSMPPEQLLFINVIVVTLLIAYFQFGPRGNVKPSKFKMGSTSSKSESQASILNSVPSKGLPGEQKNLNVVFMYNQHTFDAYEIIGVPAGSSFAVVKEAYDDMLRELPGEKRPLVEAAFAAIRTDRKIQSD